MALATMAETPTLLDGRYRLDERIGTGGMSTVYRATDIHIGRPVAIKLLREDEGRGKGWLDRARTEKALLSTLSHSSLVMLYDAHLEPDHPVKYLVMELVDGPTLASRRVTKSLSSRQLARIVEDLAEGLAAVHATGYVHRDVKPSNVLLAPPADEPDGDWTAKLTDFGIAWPANLPAQTQQGVILGTVAYIAPEQLRGAAPGTAADVFSLGLVILQSLTGGIGYPVLDDDGRPAIERLTQAPEIPSSVEPEWRDLIARMTQLSPYERPTAHDVADAASAIARAHRSVEPTPPRREEPHSDLEAPVPETRRGLRRRRGKHRHGTTLAATVALAAVATASALLTAQLRAEAATTTPAGVSYDVVAPH